MHEERYFTVEEANAAVAGLVPSLERIRSARDVMLRQGERVRERARADGGGVEGSAYWEATQVLRREVEEMARVGIILRDAESGLVDFPSLREGRVVQLCWRLGEDRITHWHEVDAGFSNRKPL